MKVKMRTRSADSTGFFEAGSIREFDDATAQHLITMGQAEEAPEQAVVAGGERAVAGRGESADAMGGESRSLAGLSVAELRAMAKKRGVAGSRRMSKESLIEALQE